MSTSVSRDATSLPPQGYAYVRTHVTIFPRGESSQSGVASRETDVETHGTMASKQVRAAAELTHAMGLGSCFEKDKDCA